MSRWTHAVCDSCYSEKEPGRDPVRVVGEALSEEQCCFCGVFTESGIYYRSDPSKTRCGGEHAPAEPK